MTQHYSNSPGISRRGRAIVIALSLIALTGCQGAHSNNDDHHATKKLDGHHDAKSEEGHHSKSEEGHHDAKSEDDHHSGKKEDDHHAGGHESNVGEPGVKADVSKIVKLVMNDQMRFEPASVEVKAGETIEFALENAGSLKHEMVIGETEELIAHGELMKKHPGMEHEEPNMLTLEAGTSGELVWKFTNAGTVNFACLQPGHFDAGMKGSVTVN